MDKTLDTVATILRAALLDPDHPESANRLRVSATKLTKAGIDIHELTFGQAIDLSTIELGYDEYMARLNNAEVAHAKALTKIAKLEAMIGKLRPPKRIRSKAAE